MERTGKGALYLDLALFAASAAFAAYTALWSSLEPHRVWGGMAVGGYVPAAIITAMLLFRYAVPVATRVWITLAATAAVTLMPLIAEAVQRAAGIDGQAQEEVLVVEASGARLLETGSPYLSVADIGELSDKLLGYNPYQPGMSIFGLPRAVFGDGWFTDARVWFAAATLAAVWTALSLLHRAGLNRGAWLRGAQAFGVLPICALTLATGGDDLPVAALCVLALSAMATRRFTLAGFAIGGAAALKLLAWPVLIVVLVLAFKRKSLPRVAAPALPLA
ncbi:MAG: glycosyltransferase 87 family protein, partial [Stackebrandtia sp.]